jgi:hypothetical protein
VTKTVEGRSGYAETGGLTITLKTADLPGGVAANALTVTVGKISVTGLSSEALPSLDPVVPTLPSGAPPVPPTTSTTTVTTGDVAAPAATGATPAPVLAGHGDVLVLGRRMPAAAALAAFGVWQLLTLSTATLYAVVDRRRRLEEHA